MIKLTIIMAIAVVIAIMIRKKQESGEADKSSFNKSYKSVRTSKGNTADWHTASLTESAYLGKSICIVGTVNQYLTDGQMNDNGEIINEILVSDKGDAHHLWLVRYDESVYSKHLRPGERVTIYGTGEREQKYKKDDGHYNIIPGITAKNIRINK